MELVRIEYTTKSKINIDAIKGWDSEITEKRFKMVDKFKPLILRIRIGHDNLVYIEDFDVITLANIRRIASYKPSKELIGGEGNE